MKNKILHHISLLNISSKIINSKEVLNDKDKIEKEEVLLEIQIFMFCLLGYSLSNNYILDKDKDKIEKLFEDINNFANWVFLKI